MINITKSHYKEVERDEAEGVFLARHRVSDGMGDTIMDFDEYTPEERNSLPD